MKITKNQYAWIAGLSIAGITLFMVFLGGDLIDKQIIKMNQIHNCEILISSFSSTTYIYTEEELRNEEVFNFSYYWGLQNDYWQCDKHFDKDKVIERLLSNE